ncbi:MULTISPECIES: hypothetical protein [Agrobacterium tumefaciens complex]|uniref:hypothetical protein n=1 Tax=Agrobacterium tumefaciens complex TaxID=1183400 RepID=UPI0009B9D3E7|nr:MULTISPECIES: hypothetical protein [Agrobacterium tumefaciens complex]MBP2532571.1 hypothetical protein [Agrobacterium tumefaciens]CUX27044.1 conserved exported hypothetical protein [Agrobacterium fabrum str. J-07]
MKKPTADDKANVLSFCFVALAAFSENALTPSQKRWARERAENCLWALGIPEHKGYRDTFTARELEEAMETIDLEATKLLTEAGNG